MYAITGITGKVGGAVARSLLAERLPVRAVLRDEAKAAAWRTRGCDVALAEMDDAASLTSAFRGAAGVFILPPSEFDPEPGFPEARNDPDARRLQRGMDRLQRARPVGDEGHYGTRKRHRRTSQGEPGQSIRLTPPPS